MNRLFALAVAMFIISLVILFRYCNSSSEKETKERMSDIRLLLKEAKQALGFFDSKYSVLKLTETKSSSQ
jgi:hypothetical protein